MNLKPVNKYLKKSELLNKPTRFVLVSIDEKTNNFNKKCFSLDVVRAGEVFSFECSHIQLNELIVGFGSDTKLWNEQEIEISSYPFSDGKYAWKITPVFPETRI